MCIFYRCVIVTCVELIYVYTYDPIFRVWKCCCTLVE